MTGGEAANADASIPRITFEDFERVELRIGTVQRAEPFPEARIPAIKLWVDLGPLGTKQSSARITDLYEPEELIGKQVLCVTNFAPRKIGPFLSEILVTGFYTDESQKAVVLATSERAAPNGARLA